MNLLEYEAKQLLTAYSIPIPKGEVLQSGFSQSPSLPIVAKSQVPVGGRGKLGGVKIVETPEQMNRISDLFSHSIKGFLPKTILVEEKINIKKELYLSLTIDRLLSSIQVIAHPDGGVEVENNDSEEFLKITTTGSNLPQMGEQLAEYYEIPNQTFALQELVKNLYECFIANDATLLEINPLILTEEGTLVAGDCKMTLDDAAAFRHPDWAFEQNKIETNFVTLNQWGNVATIANGAGLAMATVDAVAHAGLHPANFLDIGGGASSESVMRAFNKIMDYEGVKVILINIFAGITRCDEVAKAIIEAKREIISLPPLCIRLAGTNYEQAADLLNAEGIALLPTLESCLESAKRHVS